MQIRYIAKTSYLHSGFSFLWMDSFIVIRKSAWFRGAEAINAPNMHCDVV